MVDIRGRATPERQPVPEQIPEINNPAVEVRPVVKENLPENTASQTNTTVASAPVLPAKPQMVRDIETALEEGLSELYTAMPPTLQAEFRQKGEETSSKIISILQKGKDVAKKVFEAIVEWLKLIPGVNKFFLEQEAKIKTDKILHIKEK